MDIKKGVHDFLIIAYSIIMGLFLAVLARGGFAIMEAGLSAMMHDRISDKPVLEIVIGFGIILFVSTIVFAFARDLCVKRLILLVPKEVRWDASKNEKYPLNDKLRLEVLRHAVPEMFPGWQTHKDSESTGFNIIPKKFEFVRYPKGTIIRETAAHLSELDKFIVHYGFAHGMNLFLDGVRIGQRKTIWDRVFFLGPQYLVAFPSGFIIATHMDGLRPVILEGSF